nr:actin-binding LIM protein 1-like isoform X1 [Penaeus vannamei]
MAVTHHTVTTSSAPVPAAPRRSWKTLCESCGKKCSGEVLRVQEKYFHISCFKCNSCKKSLAQGGFFTREKDYYCTECYQKNFGQRCATCGLFVEGEVVSALGNTYHQKCFTCARCRQPFPTGERVTYTGKECLCQRCLHIPVVDSQSPTRSPTTAGPKCAGCKEELVEGQALIALDQQWHIWCFKCAACNTVLHGEYMGKDGMPYCEKDYQAQFGVKCAYCNRFISGKVLQAGDNHHFHPTCARCTKCGDPFGDGEEMYLQGTAIWHPRCGPGPTENGTVLNGSLSNGHHVNGEQKAERERDFDGMSSTASETQFSRSRTPSLNGSFRSYSPYNSLNRKFSGPYRTCSPGLILREYKSSQSPIDITRIYTYSYLTAEPSQGYLKRPLDPYDRPPPKSPHWHRPMVDSRKLSLPKTSSKLGMRVMVDSIKSETPRPKSPHMNNEEPITLSHYPGARKPTSGDVSRIERDDFPAPPYPYTDPDVSERRRRWSGSTKAVSIDETDEGTEIEDSEAMVEDPKLKREEEELSKIATGIGKVFLQQVKERERIRAWKATHLDPRNASRSPAANREPQNKLRFESSLNASPSRMTDHNRSWGPEEEEFDRASSYRCSTGRSSATIPSYNVVSALRGEPKPGYGLKSSTLPAAGRNGGPAGMIGDYSFTGLGEKTQSTEFSSARSDVSAGSLTEADRSALNAELCASTTYSSGLRGYTSYSPHLRRSLPNMHHMSSEPPKIYPAHLLFVSNYRLPNDVDRCHLERHLSDAEFEMIFHMSRMDFYRLPEWRRNDLKRRCKLF